jgi:uncharacterized protein (DUF433 family)
MKTQPIPKPYDNSTKDWFSPRRPYQSNGSLNKADPEGRDVLGATTVKRVDAVDGPLPLRSDPLPLRVDKGDAVRVGRSRISLDLVIEQYENGMSPEDMVRAYDTLVLADVYAVIAYYLRHRDEVRIYLKRREEEAEALRATIEAEHPPITRQELLARRSAREKADAPTRQ